MSGKLLLEAAAKIGFNTVIATTKDVYKDMPSELKDMCDKVLYIDFSNPCIATEQIVKSNKTYAYSGVVVAWEFLTDVAARVASILGLRGPEVKLARSRRNKLDMHHTWQANGCPIPQLLAIVEQQEKYYESFTNKLNFPVVVKPAENSASFGVTVVNSLKDLPEAIEKARQWTHEFPHGIPFERTVLIQEYIPGQEFSVEGISNEGIFYPWGVIIKFTTEGSSRAEIGHIFPAPISEVLRNKILAVAQKGVFALGIDNGISHTEIKLNQDGEPYLIESGPKPAGDFIPEIITIATGQNPLDIYIKQSIGEFSKEFIPSPPFQSVGIKFVRPERQGILKKIIFPPSLKDGKIIKKCITKSINDRVEPGPINMERLGWVIVSAKNSELVNSAMNNFRKNIEVVIFDST